MKKKHFKMVGGYGGGQMRLGCLQPAVFHSLIKMISGKMMILVIYDQDDRVI